MRKMKAWSEWAKEKLGYVPVRDFGSPEEVMTSKEFEDSMRGQTIIKTKPKDIVIASLRRENKELFKRVIAQQKLLDKFSDPKQGKLFKCGKEHRHFMFDCAGCQHELGEAMDSRVKEFLSQLEKFINDMMIWSPKGSEGFELVNKQKLLEFIEKEKMR
jgi:hypothetical protein